MVAFVTGSCSREEGIEFETHCLSCNECLAALAIILRAKSLERLYRSGMDAARIARKGENQKARRPSRLNNQVTASQRAAAR